MSASLGGLFGVQTVRAFTSPFQVQQERKAAGRPASGQVLLYSAGFVTELVGKRVCHGNCGPNPLKAGHLGCLRSYPAGGISIFDNSGRAGLF